jgi:transcription elongation factor Elf1
MDLKLELYPEGCCDFCGDVIHNHFDCPSCGKKNASTDIYMDVHFLDIGDELSCESCNAKFILKGNSNYDIDEYEWEKV